MFRTLRPLLFRIDPESAHRLTISSLAAWQAVGCPGAPSAPKRNSVTIAGIDFAHPICLAAGFDKDAEAIGACHALGFAGVEVGTLTPLAQAGNPKPRLFRLAEDRGVINRMGFNNGGLDAALPRIAAAKRRGVIGVNVGANKESTDRIADYAGSVAKAAPLADHVTINISSPNTPGLRDLQDPALLGELLAACDGARMVAGKRVPLFLKIAPDLDRVALEPIVRTVIDAKIDALIVSNTTISRPELRSRDRGQAGGLSGKPLQLLAREKLGEVVAIASGAIPLISAGGIDSTDEARRRLDMGASLVQLYSALVFEGPGLARRIANGL